MIRAYIYLCVAGIIWMVEGFLFSHFLHFKWWQVILLALVYLGLYGLAVTTFLRSLDSPNDMVPGSTAWRAVSVAPMFVVIVGSFASLPIILLVAAAGKLA
ncbi:MAG: hypothetical protein NVSMB52_04450 [Chloroflexota bacterium]